MQLHIPEISMNLQPLQGQELGTSQESRAGVGSPRHKSGGPLAAQLSTIRVKANLFLTSLHCKVW